MGCVCVGATNPNKPNSFGFGAYSAAAPAQKTNDKISKKPSKDAFTEESFWYDDPDNPNYPILYPMKYVY